MKSLRNLADRPASAPLGADDIVEFHAARLLLLLRFAGTANSIDGLTKLAKLDFFVRYPSFFREVVGVRADTSLNLHDESSMIRHHYGPWDPRYYHVLSYLEAKGLLTVAKQRNSFIFRLTQNGERTSAKLGAARENESLVQHITAVKRALGAKAGSTLKKLIYERFEQEIANLPRGRTIV